MSIIDRELLLHQDPLSPFPVLVAYMYYIHITVLYFALLYKKKNTRRRVGEYKYTSVKFYHKTVYRIFKYSTLI